MGSNSTLSTPSSFHPRRAIRSAGGRDVDGVPEAVDRLLTDVVKRLRAANADVLVEFRQSYIGPMMRKYGNMFRSGDVPGDFHGNRLNTLDIRLISLGTPAHSDMVMWHASDSVESAAMQLWHTLFSVPQVSMLLDRLPRSHLDMVRHYISFWRRHADVLLDGDLIPLEPGFLYPAAIAANANKLIAAWYGSSAVSIPSASQEDMVLVNGTLSDCVVLDLGESAGRRRAVVRDCTGKLVRDETVQLRAGLHRIEIPPAGAAEMRG